MAKTNLYLTAYNISDMIERLGVLQDNIKTACEDITTELVETGLKLAIENDSYAPNSGNNDYSFVSDVNRGKGYIAMVGDDSVYVEFGTGDVGADNPHPLHSKIPGINPYNSGPTIKLDDMGRHYWVYKPLANVGDYYFDGGLTYGIPAGCQMYNTLLELQELAPNVTKKHLSQAIKRL